MDGTQAAGLPAPSTQPTLTSGSCCLLDLGGAEPGHLGHPASFVVTRDCMCVQGTAIKTACVCLHLCKTGSCGCRLVDGGKTTGPTVCLCPHTACRPEGFPVGQRDSLLYWQHLQVPGTQHWD